MSCGSKWQKNSLINRYKRSQIRGSINAIIFNTLREEEKKLQWPHYCWLHYCKLFCKILRNEAAPVAAAEVRVFIRTQVLFWENQPCWRRRPYMEPREDPVCLEDSTDWWLFIFIPVYTRVKKVRTTSVLNTSDKMKIIPFSVQKKTWFRPQQCDCRSCSGDRVYGDERHLFYMRGFKIIMVLKNILFWTRTAAALTWIENGKTEIK